MRANIWWDMREGVILNEDSWQLDKFHNLQIINVTKLIIRSDRVRTIVACHQVGVASCPIRLPCGKPPTRLMRLDSAVLYRTEQVHPERKSWSRGTIEGLRSILKNFLIVVIGSPRSKAESQSAPVLRTADLVEFLSRRLSIRSMSAPTMCSGPMPFLPPYWAMSSLPAMSSRIQSFVKDSRTLL